MKTTWLIGCVCKSGDAFSLAVLIDRGLDLHGQSYDKTNHFGCRGCDAPLHNGSTFFLVCFIQFSGSDPEKVGADDGEGTPVPIPNTAVKLTRADNTWLEAARDNK